MPAKNIIIALASLATVTATTLVIVNQKEKLNEILNGESKINLSEIIPNKTTEKSPEIIQQENITIIPPAIDVARIDKDGYLIVAGKGQPNAKIEIYQNKILAHKTKNSKHGEWIYQPKPPLPSGITVIDVTQIHNNSKIESQTSLFLIVPENNSANYIAVLTDNNGKNSEIINENIPDLPNLLALKIIDYDNSGQITLQGQGMKNARINVYLNDKFIGHSIVNKQKKWTFKPKQKIKPDNYTLRLDLIPHNTTKVTQRIELPFTRAHIDKNSAQQQLKNGYRVIVQPGNSLWRIARKKLGKGTLYTIIYQQNKDQIRNPNLIYPGQIFTFKDK